MLWQCTEATEYQPRRRDEEFQPFENYLTDDGTNKDSVDSSVCGKPSGGPTEQSRLHPPLPSCWKVPMRHMPLLHVSNILGWAVQGGL